MSSSSAVEIFSRWSRCRKSVATLGCVLIFETRCGCGEGRLVAFVVPVAAVAVEIDDHVAPELLAEFEGELRGEEDFERVVAVDVENRGLDHFGHVGRVSRTPRVGRQRRKADLVVDDDVNRSAGPVSLELRKVEHLGDHPLPGKRRIAVNQQRQNLLPLGGVPERALPGAGLAFDDRIHRFEVARVRREIDRDVMSVAGLAA